VSAPTITCQPPRTVPPGADRGTNGPVGGAPPRPSVVHVHASSELLTRRPTTDRPTIVVGYDGSSRSLAAIEWAAREAHDRHAAVRVITCLGVRRASDAGTPLCPDLVPVCDAAVRLLENQVEDQAHHDARIDPVEFSIDVVHGSAWERLVLESQGSEMLVIGTAGHLLLGAWRLGAVAHELIRHAPCPVVLVPDGEPHVTRDRVVVGVDRATSGRALDWAADEAGRRHAELVIVHASTPPSPLDAAAVEPEAILEAARRRAGERCGTKIVTRLADGHPAPALLAQAFNADLLVIGSRPNGHSSGEAGSVARAVAACATAPTVVVRPDLEPAHAT
jgi:nucleotide-binding universal stress UspA family protein